MIQQYNTLEYQYSTVQDNTIQRPKLSKNMQFGEDADIYMAKK